MFGAYWPVAPRVIPTQAPIGMICKGMTCMNPTMEIVHESMAKRTVNYVFVFILKTQHKWSKSKANFGLFADFCPHKLSIKKYLLHWNSIDNHLFLSFY